MALGLRADAKAAQVFVLMGDGEQAEGSVWEAAMSAAKYRLDNLTAFVDRNGLQISGPTEEVMPLDGLKEKYEAFGWEAAECDGHDPEDIIGQVGRPRKEGKPRVIIAHTTKGYGSKLMEGAADWHHLIPDDGQYETIRAHLLEHLRGLR